MLGEHGSQVHSSLLSGLRPNTFLHSCLVVFLTADLGNGRLVLASGFGWFQQSQQGCCDRLDVTGGGG